jgi:hypothetical protein
VAFVCGSICVVVRGWWEMLFEDCEQFENPREFLSGGGSGYSEKPFVVAFERPGDVKDEPHAINLRSGPAGGVLPAQHAHTN